MIKLQRGMILVHSNGKEEKIFSVRATGTNIHVGPIVTAKTGDSIPIREVTLPALMPTTLERMTVNGLQIKASMKPVATRWFELM